jgi:hypothetical protein
MRHLLTSVPAALVNGFKRAPLAVGAAGALVIGLGVGAAWGYFASSGAGSGVVSVGAKSVTVEAATGTPSSVLIPGTSADLTLTLDNPNSYPVTIVSITQNGPVTAVGQSGTCSNTAVSVPAQSGLRIPLASGEGVVVHIPNGASMGATSNSGCQGASFHIPVTITVQQG